MAGFAGFIEVNVGETVKVGICNQFPGSHLGGSSTVIWYKNHRHK